MNDKVRATHLERRAVVYLRQSTLRQVHEHRESTARQYALRQRALELGWPPERIDIIDEDMGQSGTNADKRTGFQRLAEAVAHGRVGVIFSLEVSRLARSSADWHRLLDLCGLADVLLGLKGTMSEAKLYWMRLRLQGGRLSDVNVLVGFVAGYQACLGDNGIEDTEFAEFSEWLRTEKREFPPEGWANKYLRDCNGNHLAAIRKFLDFVAEFRSQRGR